MSAQRTTDPNKLLAEVVQAATGGKAFKQATRALGENERQSLSRAIGMDVDEWRIEFGQKLRETGSKLLQLLHDKADDIKPDALAYSIAVMADKAQALDGRSQLANASINVQINNFGGASKSSLLDQLEGRTVTQIESFATPTDGKTEKNAAA